MKETKDWFMFYAPFLDEQEYQFFILFKESSVYFMPLLKNY